MTDEELMEVAIDAAASVRTSTAPDPWVGAVVQTVAGEVHVGATRASDGAHAETVALAAAAQSAVGATLVTTLEPCSSTSGSGPCTHSIVDAGIERVVVGVADPDARTSGSGIDALRSAGLEVVVGVLEDRVTEQLVPYLHHRRTGRPYVVAKASMTFDGRTAAPDSSSRWIAGEAARADSHHLRAESQAVVVGAGTVRSDDPTLTTRFVDGPSPRRVVLGSAPPDAKIQPCLEWRGELDGLLDRLGSEGVLQVLVEGGSNTITQFHSEGLVDRFVVYIAPATFGGDDGHPMFVGAGAPTMDEIQRGRFVDVRRIGDDLRIDLVLD